MTDAVPPAPGDESAMAAARAADAKGGTDTVVLRVGAVLGITDLFVVTGAGNARLVKAVAEEIEQRVAEE